MMKFSRSAPFEQPCERVPASTETAAAPIDGEQAVFFEDPAARRKISLTACREHLDRERTTLW
jgi:hypothetical protein